MMKPIKWIARVIYYFLILLVYSGRSVHWGFSHDENQFIAAGQMLADHGLLPYINYPYTHMPYGVFFYALTALSSAYDYLAGRVLNALLWLLCSLLIVYIFRRFWKTGFSIPGLLWEFTIVYVFLVHPSLSVIAGEALNHSLASFFSLLSLMFYLQFSGEADPSKWKAFGCGVCICLAALIRFNYASLVLVLFILMSIEKLVQRPPRSSKTWIYFSSGLLAAAVPALALLVLAPAGFYFTNIVYTRLNTIYYQELLFRSNMDLPAKVTGFLSHLLSSPIDIILYSLMAISGISSFIYYLRRRSSADLNKLALASFSFTLFLTAFAPTPTQQQYFFAPLPFMVILLAVFVYEFYQKNKWGIYMAIPVVLLALNPGLKISNPLPELGYLSDPSQWTPLQVHEFGNEIHQYVPKGRILTLIPMIPLEAGYDIYPFTTTGPFIWRTSLLLTSQRRARYGVISPEELRGILIHDPPDGILTGFESPYNGFSRDDPGTLETPLIDYAKENGYKPVVLPSSFVQRPITLWVKGP